MRPSASLIAVWSVWCVLSAATLLQPEAGAYPGILGGVLLALTLGDIAAGFRVRRRGLRIAIQRGSNGILFAGVAKTATVEVHLAGGKIPRHLTIYEQLPGALTAYPYPIRAVRGDFTAAGIGKFSVEWTGMRRGRWHSSALKVEYPTPLGFFHLLDEVKNPIDFTVLPDLRERPTDDCGLEGIWEQSGQTSVRRRGEGTDFRELRDYVPGDSVRHIDWRATSRRRNPMVRSYQDDRDRQIVILLDGGYRLHQKEGRGLQFDYALVAVLRLAAVALGHGDSVGVYADGEEKRWIAPAKGHSHYWNLLNRLFDFESTAAPTSHSATLGKILARLNKLSFIILITNFREEDAALMDWILPLVRGRHLMMAVSMREEGASAPSEPVTLDDALYQGAVALYREQRICLRRYWEKRGIITLDTRPGELSPLMINRYLALKGAGVL